MENITAQVDVALLQEKANEFATKGALKAIEEHYTSYNSPYKKSIEAALEAVEVPGYGIKLPDILALINESLSSEIAAIANTAVAQTFVPLVNRFLTRQDKFQNFSKILKEFIETAEEKHYDYFDVTVKKHEQYGWLNVRINDAERNYEFTLHQTYESKKADKQIYSLLSLPHTDATERHKMILKVDGASLELPFTPNVLKDAFTSYMAGFIISKTEITMDTDSFDEDMFPEACHCH